MRGAPPPLYPWQAEAINLVAASRRSLCYTAPTGGGKSRVADELLRLSLTNFPAAKALVVLPYVALVREKVASLESLLRPLGIKVRGYAGVECEGAPLGSSRERCAVTTIEKASSCVNRLFETGEISLLSVVVVDELHMVSEDERGCALEGMLAKIRHGVKSGKVSSDGPQIVCMSATVGKSSMERLARWLDAEIYVSHHRPVELKEYVVCVGGVYAKENRGEAGWELTRVADSPSRVELEIKHDISLFFQFFLEVY